MFEHTNGKVSVKIVMEETIIKLEPDPMFPSDSIYPLQAISSYFCSHENSLLSKALCRVWSKSSAEGRCLRWYTVQLKLLPSYRTSQLNGSANQLTGFYMLVTLTFNELRTR